MTVLPSGRVVGIMPERARLHAARLKLRVTESTPHHQLYPLIDVLVDPRDHSHTSARPTSFSGYTLADRNWLNQWEAPDRRFFLEWIRERSQIATIEQARRRLLLEKAIPKGEVFPYPLRLYSLLHRRIAALSMRRASVGQWKRTLLNMKRDGLRREELDWSGLIGFLSQRPQEAMVARDELLAAIDISTLRPRLSNELEAGCGCCLPFNEVASRLPIHQLQMADYPVADQDIGVVRYRSATSSYRVGILWPEGRALHGVARQKWFVLGPYGRAIVDPGERSRRFFGSAGEALAVANQHAMQSHRLRPSQTFTRHYEYMSLDGGSEYREWLVTLPDYHDSYFSSHFNERNILLHIRSKLRTTRDGCRVLFIEEIQSDWHQAIARYGRHSGIPLAPFRREWATLALKLMLMHVVAEGLDGLAWSDAKVHELRYDKLMTPLRRLYDEELPRSLNQLAKGWQTEVGRGAFLTRRPWLHATRSKASWKVTGGEGSFSTRARYSQQEAMALIVRHSKEVTLELPLFRLPEGMRQHIAEHGLPLFGEQLV